MGILLSCIRKPRKNNTERSEMTIFIVKNFRGGIYPGTIFS